MDTLTIAIYAALLVTLVFQLMRIKELKVRSVKSSTEKTALMITSLLAVVAAFKSATTIYHWIALGIGLFIILLSYYKTGVTLDGFLIMSRVYTPLRWRKVKKAHATLKDGLIEIVLDHTGRVTRLYFNESDKDVLLKTLGDKLEVSGDGLKQSKKGKPVRTRRK